MTGIFKLAIACSLTLLCNAKAYSSALVDDRFSATLREDTLLEIQGSREWQHLVQYTSRILGRRHSEIQSSHSFFSSKGKTQPLAELIATIDALATPLSSLKLADEHPRCKFIARYEYLKTKIEFPPHTDKITCPKFTQWIDISNVDSVSLVFASGYFKNPASFYGHPLLKFNGSKPDSQGLLDITINNGAIIPPNENPIVYVVKGVFGGYQAAFSDTTFYQLNHSYSEDDLRDLWNYQLDLSQEQKERLIYYSWELLNQRFTYRFFSNNCGYFLEDLLQYALGERLSPRNRIYSVPANTFFNAVAYENNGKPLVKDISRTPSRQTKLHESYDSLSASDQRLVHHFVNNNSIDLLDASNNIISVIDTLTDYYSYLLTTSDDDKTKSTLMRVRTQLYRQRLGLKSKPDLELATTPVDNPDSTPPHTGSPPSLIRLGYLNNSVLGDGYRLRIRPVSYDLLDLDGGHIPNSTLNMFNLEASSFDGQLRVSQFDLVNIKTLNVSRTGLPGDGGLGWGLRLGLERANNSCINCLLTHISASGIKAKRFNSWLSAYVQGEVSYHSNFEGGSIRSKLNVSSVIKPLPWWKSEITIGTRFSIDGDADSETIVNWQNRIGADPNRNIRFDVNYDGEHEVHLGYGWYW